MIAHLKGTVLSKTTQSVIIDAGGIGYEVVVPLSTFYSLPDEEEKVSLHIYTHVREDILSLFGFQTTLEKKVFLLLISVAGIGPKLAINILSGMGPQELVEAIALGDTPRLQSIPGVGRKTAERITLELREKAANLGMDLPPSPGHMVARPGKGIRDDALSALINLGYQAKSAKQAVEKAHGVMGDGDLEGLIKEALKSLMK